MKNQECGNKIPGSDVVVSKVPSIKDQVIEVIESIEQLYERKGAISGLSTGLENLDQMIGGLHGAEVIVIGSRPSMGKTSLGMNIAEHVALQCNHAVLIFSLDMSSHQLLQRFICSRARVNLTKVRDGYMSELDYQSICNAAQQIAESKLIIDDTGGISISELQEKARQIKTQHDIKLIIIDCLQMIQSTSGRSQNNPRLEISTGIKTLAKELAIPIIVVAQLNRKPEFRRGRPLLSDIRESGNIEHCADVVGLLVREEFYAETEEELMEAEGKATLIIAKQRNGPTGYVPLRFLKEFTRFEDRTEIE